MLMRVSIRNSGADGGSGEKQRLEGGRASTYWKATGSMAGRVQSADQRPSCMHDL